MREPFTLGDFRISWLHGGKFRLDGGAMFGPVPKKLWDRKYPSDGENTISLAASPILVRTPDANIIIETGIGNKLTEKQKSIFKVEEEWDLPADLDRLGIGRDDIHYVILTHYDFDHAGGVVMEESGAFSLTFPRAAHILQRTEWEDVMSTTRRAAGSYWPVNYELLGQEGKLELVDGSRQVVPGVSVILTGGHHRGHQMVVIESGGQTMVHMADLFPTHVHFNPLWVMSYDDYPLEVIGLKEEWQKKGIAGNFWFSFYHDPFLCACRFDASGSVTERWPV